MRVKDIPDIIVGRLLRYLRALQGMQQEGFQTTSSQELGQYLGISAAQIRNDLSQFGEFGKQGTGYSIPFLIRQLQQILKVDRMWETVLVGMGDLGHAISRYQGFLNCGFRIVEVFDNDPQKVGSKAGAYTIRDIAELSEVLDGRNIRLAMLTVPAAAAQPVAEMLIKAGIRGILNYAPVTLNVPEGVYVQYIDPVIHLQRMTYYLE
jgi:redox-sensing transcriptional repressor